MSPQVLHGWEGIGLSPLGIYAVSIALLFLLVLTVAAALEAYAQKRRRLRTSSQRAAASGTVAHMSTETPSEKQEGAEAPELELPAVISVGVRLLKREYQAPFIVMVLAGALMVMSVAGAIWVWRASVNVRVEMESAAEAVERPKLEEIRRIAEEQAAVQHDHETRLRALELIAAGMASDLHSMKDDVHEIRNRNPR